jgi:hypothetical protein
MRKSIIMRIVFQLGFLTESFSPKNDNVHSSILEGLETFWGAIGLAGVDLKAAINLVNIKSAFIRCG